ncbi:hypothetical protein AXG93_4284s1230 [Marchantia polymorpha subsp. ruderalis]|uniref:Uncharacterized protein n=1 Tax=Marchantia polymorpha subsp. ruderalis TaxID=1480154 RepID=A0A176VT31_MARPO|nr:hypothetical protein AXG93_4284s1230 [Marchantia polymorpha subsp. ruderalis]
MTGPVLDDNARAGGQNRIKPMDTARSSKDNIPFKPAKNIPASRDRDIMEYSSSKGIAGVKFEDKKGLGGCRVQ